MTADKMMVMVMMALLRMMVLRPNFNTILR